MKKFIKVLSVSVALALTCSTLAACKTNEKDEGNDGKPTYEASGYKLVENGVSEYVILLSESPNGNEYTAAEELVYFMKAATKADLPIVQEGSYVVSESSSVISIGDTAYADKKGIETDGTLDNSGYVMKTVGNQLFIRADGNGMGCVYAVYDLLESAVGYRYYYTDEIYYEEKGTVDLYKYDIVADPSFDFRAISTWNNFLYSNPDYMRRTRTVRKDAGFAWGEMHMQTRTGGVVSKDEWFDSHHYGTLNDAGEPDHWFSPDGNQLCWTAGEEMYEQAARDIFKRVEQKPDATYFEIGQADTLNSCRCERCVAAIADWAGNYAGLQSYFLDRVASYVNAWMAESYPTRKIRLVAFAYYETEEAPVKATQQNGKWVPYSEKVIPTQGNVDYYFTPIGTDYSKNLTDVENKEVYEHLLQWRDFLEGRDNGLMLYTYDTNFHYFFYNFNNFATFGLQAKAYSDAGVDFIHSQGANNNNQPTFPEMRYFVESQILWDTSRNYEELATEFMEHFYKDAAEEIHEYYDLTRMRYEQMTTLHGMQFTTIYANIGDKSIWTEGVVDAIDEIFSRAYAKIEHYKVDDPDMYSKLYDRIKELELTQIYTKLQNYSINYTQRELNALVDDFNTYTLKYDISRYREGAAYSTEGLFDSLKK